MGLRAIVRNGRFVIDEPTTLPEGTELELVVETALDDDADAERAALVKSIEASVREFEEGKGIPAEIVLARLRANTP